MKTHKLTILLWFLSIVLLAQTNNDSLQHYINIAIENNPHLQAQHKAYEAAKEQIQISKTLPEPTLSVGYAITPIETKQGSQDAKISAMQPIPWFGTLKAHKKHSQAETEALYEKYLSEQKDLVREIKNNWYELYFIQKNIDLIKQQTLLLKTLENQITTKLQNNNSSLVDVLEVQMAIDKLKNKIKTLNSQKQVATTKFNLALNRDEKASIYIVDTLSAVSDTIFLSTIAQHNELNSAKKQVEAMEHKLKATHRSNKPMLGIGLDYAFISKDENVGGENAIMPMVSISLPIYFKKNKAKVKQATLQKEKAIIKAQETKNDLLLQYQIAKEQYNTAQNDIKLYQTLLIKTQQALSIVQVEYFASDNDIENLIKWYETLLTYQIDLSKATTELHKAIANMNYLTKN